MRFLHFIKPDGFFRLQSDAEDDSSSEANRVCLMERDETEEPSDINESDASCLDHKKIPVWRAVFNVINYMEGAGFLVLPYAIRIGGLGAAIILLLMPLLMIYTTRILVECLYDEDEEGRRVRVYNSYQGLLCSCWPPTATMVRWIMCIHWFIGGVSFLVAAASLLNSMFPEGPITQAEWAGIIMIVTFPTLFIRSLRDMSWLSTFSFVATLAAVTALFWFEFTVSRPMDIKQLMFWNTSGVLLSTNMAVMGYSIHEIVINIEGSLQDRSQFNVVMMLSYAIETFLKLLFGVIGFLTYSTEAKEVIIENLPHGVPRKIITVSSSLFILLTLSFYLMMLLSELENSTLAELINSKLPKKITNILLRVFLVLAILVAGDFIPHFALLLSVAGLANYALAIFFPAALHLNRKLDKLSKTQIIADMVLIVLQILGSSLGCFYAVYGIIIAV